MLSNADVDPEDRDAEAAEAADVNDPEADGAVTVQVAELLTSLGILFVEWTNV